MIGIEKINAQALNSKFGIENALSFENRFEDFVFAHLNFGRATAELSVYGGHVTKFAVDNKPVLWLSPGAEFEFGKAIRGGVPICWPWFGPHPTDNAKPSHGFARNSLWNVANASADEFGVRIQLRLQPTPKTLELYPENFDLKLDVVLTDALSIKLTAKNLADKSVQMGGALHSYFCVDDVEKTEVLGLENTLYLDQLDSHNEKQRSGPVVFCEEVDRVYFDTNPSLLIHDGRRKIQVEKTGSKSTVVWNPWLRKEAHIGDMPTNSYKSFVCVETANAFNDVRSLESGASHTISQTIIVDE